MAQRRTPPVTVRIADEATERVRRNHEERLTQLEGQLAPLVISGVKLANTINVVVPHRLGRRPRYVGVSCVRGALSTGIVRDVTDRSVPGIFNQPVDETQVVVLRADGFGATVTVDLLVL